MEPGPYFDATFYPGTVDVSAGAATSPVNFSVTARTSIGLHTVSTYSFPGNIRELRNLLERALILGQHPQLQPEDFHLQGSAAPARFPHAELTIEELAALLPKRLDLREVLSRFERALLERALEMTNGVQAEAARHLEISRSDLGYKVTKFALSTIPRTNAE